MIDIEFDITVLPDTDDIVKYISEMEGGITIKVNERIFYQEPNFPIMYFAVIATDWLKHIGGREYETFLFIDDEYEEKNLLSFEHQLGGWTLRSGYQEFESPVFSNNELAEALKVFLENYKHVFNRASGKDYDSLMENFSLSKHPCNRWLCQ